MGRVLAWARPLPFLRDYFILKALVVSHSRGAVCAPKTQSGHSGFGAQLLD
jgi:hypothetical protein